MARYDCDARSLTRRQALAVIGGYAGVAALVPDVLAQKKLAFPKGSIIRTLFKDVPPEAIGGPILFHEHLSIDLPPNLNPRPADAPPPPTPQPPATANVDLIVEEVKAAARDGVRCIVDGGHPDMKRNLEKLKTIANRTDVLVVASGGYYI